MVKTICFLFIYLFIYFLGHFFRSGLWRFWTYSGNADLGDFEAFLSEIGGPTSGQTCSGVCLGWVRVCFATP